jgi:hypothetical protein
VQVYLCVLTPASGFKGNILAWTGMPIQL